MTRRLVLLLFLALPAVADDLYLFVNAEPKAFGRPGMVVTYRVVLRNGQEPPARDVTVAIPLPPGELLSVEPEHPDWRCTSSATEVVCRRDVLPVTDIRTDQGIRVKVKLSEDRRGMNFNGIARATAAPPATFSQSEAAVQAITTALFSVTSSADSGPGTLRAIIEETNAHCTGSIPCTVSFDLPPRTTIEPLTPLPPITSCYLYMPGNGTREGDRRVELSGAKLTAGSGLEFHTHPTCVAPMEIEDLAINRFPDYAVLIGESTHGIDLRGLFLGTDVTGRELRPNTRGLGVFHRAATVWVRNSIIRGNRRSGVFAWSGTVSIDRSLIEHNGASGVFIAHGRMTVFDSTVAHNSEFGLAVASPAELAAFLGGSMHSNGITGIDWHLDGPSRVPPPPTITDAFYDPARNVTVVTGTVARASFRGPKASVQLYVSRMLNPSGYAEGERYLGLDRLLVEQPDGTFTFRFEIAEDLRGQIVTAATGPAVSFEDPAAWTTEFSAGVTVR